MFSAKRLVYPICINIF